MTGGMDDFASRAVEAACADGLAYGAGEAVEGEGLTLAVVDVVEV